MSELLALLSDTTKRKIKDADDPKATFLQWLKDTPQHDETWKAVCDYLVTEGFHAVQHTITEGC
jgi:hypothetical protein